MTPPSSLEKTIRLYFDASNDRDFGTIESLLHADSLYDSENTGLHVGRGNILEMMRAFFDKFLSIEWTIESLEERDGDTGEILFTLKKEDQRGAITISRGWEKIRLRDGLISSIEVRNL